MEELSEAAAAALGGAISATVLCPLEVIKTVSSSKRKKDEAKDGEEGVTSRSSGNSVAREILEKEGISGFYRGVHLTAFENAVEKAAYFSLYTWLRRITCGLVGKVTIAQDLVLGYCTEALTLPLTLPLQNVLARTMTSPSRASSFAILQQILSEGGWKGLYRGLSSYWVLCLKPAIQYAIFNQLKVAILAYESAKQRIQVTTLTAFQAFVTGALARAAATLLVFPYIRMKVLRMTNTNASLTTLVKEEGFSSLFTGLAPEVLRGALSAALMLAIKEKLGGVSRRLLTGTPVRRTR